MNILYRILTPAIIAGALIVPAESMAQHRGASRQSQGTTGQVQPTRSNRSSASRPGGSSTRPSQNMTQRPKVDARPTTTGSRKPDTPRTEQGYRHGNNKGNNKDYNKGKNHGHGNSYGHGNNHGHGHDNGYNPGHGHGNSYGHGNGYGHNHGNNYGHSNNYGHGYNPGHNHGHGYRPGGNSAPRPGGWAHAPRPHYNYRNPGYRPPRPGGGYWGAPAPCPYRINYWVPPVPRYVTVMPAVPSIGTILGLTFGSFIDAGINSLFNAGYTVSGYYNDAIYLNNVRQLGYLWPEVIVRYNDGLMCGTQFYNWSAYSDQAMYYSLYNQLTSVYGAPVDIRYSNSGPTATWWAGGNTGYVTLSFGYGASTSGLNNYYTSLTYTAY